MNTQSQLAENVGLTANVDQHNLKLIWVYYLLTGFFPFWYFVDQRFIEGHTLFWRLGLPLACLPIIYLFHKKINGYTSILNLVALNIPVPFFLPILYQSEGTMTYIYLGCFSMAPVVMTVVPLWQPKWLWISLGLHLSLITAHLLWIQPNLSWEALVLTLAYYYSFTLMAGLAAMFHYGTQVREYRLRNELAEANRTKDRFFSVISHDLRGPIGSMAIIFQMLLQGRQKFTQELQEDLAHSTANIKRLLDDLLNWAKSQQGKLELRLIDFSLAGPARLTVDLLAETARQKRLQLIDQSHPAHLVHADITMVTTVIRNLLSNAIKFSPEETTITLQSFDEGSWIRFEVVDEGMGIDPDKLEKLFSSKEPPFRFSEPQKETSSGMGLVLSAEFVKKNGGQIGADSVLGKGSRFWFTLPKGIGGPTEAEEVPLVLPKGVRQFLLVEDNPLHRHSGMTALNQLQAEYELAFDGGEGIEKARSQQFQVVLMDIDLPQINGIEASLAIRNLPGLHPKIIALTSYSQEEVADKFGFSQFDGYLHKPLEAEQLVALLNSLFA